MTLTRSLSRTLGFTVLYVLATYASPRTTIDSTGLSLVWPAAGVGAVWFLAQRASRWRVLDMVALSAVTMVVNMATGAPATLAAFFVAANLTQAWAFTYLFRRWLPHLWGGGGDRPLARLNELWRLIGVTLVSAGCGALIGPTGIWVVDGAYSPPATAVWLTHNTVSIMLIGVAGIRLGYLCHHVTPGFARSWAWLRRRWSATAGPRRGEYLAVIVLSAAAYTAAFGFQDGLPLAFSVLVMTIWTGLRLHTGFVILHDVVFGAVAMLFTLGGMGAFAQITSHPVRVLTAQTFVGLIAVVGLSLALGRDERVALIADLRRERKTAADQAALMSAILNSMTEGLTVIDEQGRFLLRNPAGRDLLGGVVSTSGRVAEPGYYGLFHPDGTALTVDEMPYRRALAGESVRGMDIVVRNPGLSDGRVLSISAIPLPGVLNGSRCAVTVFHDVTAERRHRDELAAFAGVVAHDLLNPLSTIEGWTETLAETFVNRPDAPSAGALDTTARIRRAAVRMRILINDLLAYTTARDATIAPAAVDLGDVVRDIVTGRIDQAASNGMPVPVVTVGDLHTANADPVLVRQLFDNLISNAIKYTAPGATAEIEVSSSTADGLVTVSIADNGIGIPAGQHHSVFDNFHRAHLTSGYTGTGLGLGICKRIVERHGGTITAADNPTGHGSLFTFTLPDAASGPSPAVPGGVSGPSPAVPGTDSGPSSAVPGGVSGPSPVAAVGAPPGVPRPADRFAPLPVRVPGDTFEYAARLVLDYLHDQLPLAFWAITKLENGRQVYLYLDADNGYGLRQGGSHAWEDSYCVHMVAGRAPTVAPDAQAVPAYANAAVNDVIAIGAYAGAPITEPDGTVFGAICGLDPQTRTRDPRMVAAEPVLASLGQLLTAALAAERGHARQRSTVVVDT